MKLLWLFAVYPFLFLLIGFGRDFFVWTGKNVDKWWAFPLAMVVYLTVFDPLLVAGLILIGTLAFG